MGTVLYREKGLSGYSKDLGRGNQETSARPQPSPGRRGQNHRLQRDDGSKLGEGICLPTHPPHAQSSRIPRPSTRSESVTPWRSRSSGIARHSGSHKRISPANSALVQVPSPAGSVENGNQKVRMQSPPNKQFQPVERCVRHSRFFARPPMSPAFICIVNKRCVFVQRVGNAGVPVESVIGRCRHVVPSIGYTGTVAPRITAGEVIKARPCFRPLMLRYDPLESDYITDRAASGRLFSQLDSMRQSPVGE